MNLTTVLPKRTEDQLRVPWWTKGDLNAFFGLAFNILVNVLTLTGLLIFVVQMPPQTVLGTVLPALGIALIVGNVYYTILARRLARRENRTDVTAMPYGPERAAHVHRGLRDHAADLPADRRPGAGLAGRAGLGLHHRRDRADRRLHRAVHPQDHAARRAARHPGRHLDQLHLDAPRRPDLGCGLDRSTRARHHPGRLLHRPEAARRHAGRPGRAAGRHGDRLDRRLHVGARRGGGGQRHRHRGAVVEHRAADPGAGRHGAAAGHGRAARASTTSSRR